MSLGYSAVRCGIEDAYFVICHPCAVAAFNCHFYFRRSAGRSILVQVARFVAIGTVSCTAVYKHEDGRTCLYNGDANVLSV